MVSPSTWLKIKPAGLYCVPGDFFIDPMLPVESALITHGHADHARTGHKKVLATADTLAIMKSRYGENFSECSQIAAYHQQFNINNVRVTFLPAGHILGSAQIVMFYAGTRIIVSGDYKRAADPTCEPFEVCESDVFITEATFGLPFFQHPPIEQEIKKLLVSREKFPDRTHLIGCYALGKCQRLLTVLRQQGHDDTVYLHGAMKKLCDLYEQLHVPLGKCELVSPDNKKNLAGHIVLCPPSALHTPWTRGMPTIINGMASGWMQIRARAKQKGIELPLVISDHADWSQLTQTIHEVNAPEVWITHGNEEALLHYLTQKGINAKELTHLASERTEDEE